MLQQHAQRHAAQQEDTLSNATVVSSMFKGGSARDGKGRVSFCLSSEGSPEVAITHS